MEHEKIKQLINDFENSKLTVLEVEFPDGAKIKMEKQGEACANNVAEIDKPKQEKMVADIGTEKGNIVKSPMVGTFYSRPAPDQSPYVEVGKNVKKGDVLCIIEAMKLMNEIESEFTGKIKEILVKDGETIEYGKPLFIIE